MEIKIRDFRDRASLSQKRFAELVGCTQSNINHIEKRGQDVGVLKLARWAERLGCSFDDLAGPTPARDD